MRRLALCAIVLLLAAAPAAPARAQEGAPQGFADFIQALWPDAQALGVSRATFETATRGLTPDLTLPDLAVAGRPVAPSPQPEFVQVPADYVKEATIARLAVQGRQLAGRHRAELAAAERRYGVPGPIVLAIWGRESDFGRAPLAYNAIRVLATQAFTGRRKEQFRQEFLFALKILDEGHVKLADMKSSWAGAMGLTQFLPSEFIKYAVDGDGDGRKNIWTSVADALVSTAHQLSGKGWQRGEPWAWEVRVPPTQDCTLARPEHVMPVAEWVRQGVTLANGGRFSPAALKINASLLEPEGAQGPAFLTPRNYFVLKDYNFSDLYVLFVGHLADRIANNRAFFDQSWTRTRQLRTAQVETMQRELMSRGFYQDKIDGRAGMQTRAALGTYQKKNGLKVDCWPSGAVLDHMLGRPRSRRP